jgi:MFS family permease
VGASLLAKNVQTTRSSRKGALSLTSIASRLAPTGNRRQTCNQFDFKAALLLLWLLIFLPYISGWLADHFGSRLVYSSAIVLFILFILFILFVLQRAPAKD